METIYKERYELKKDELHDLYMQLYGNDAMFAELCEHLYAFYKERSEKLKTLDKKREADPNWYKKNDMLGMMFYIYNFSGNMKGAESKIDYLEKNNVNYIHLISLCIAEYEEIMSKKFHLDTCIFWIHRLNIEFLGTNDLNLFVLFIILVQICFLEVGS